jgi:ribose 5-phosphate isomerase A
MEWTPFDSEHPAWPLPIANAEAKEAIATTMAERLRDGEVVGVGSGSTSYLTLVALADRARHRGWRFTVVATSLEIEIACRRLGVETAGLRGRRPDWSFDGADEIDPARDMIKGRGGAILRERLVMASSPERYVVADATKRVERLGRRTPVPLEIVPESLSLVRTRLLDLVAADQVRLRSAAHKDGPVITEHGNLLLDAVFPRVDDELESRLKAIPGVVDTGLFFGFDPRIVDEA